MNFNFQQMKPVIQREFDDIFENYPTDLSFIREKIPVGGDPYERKRIIVENASEFCPVHIFAHYPFAFEMDMGEPREVCYIGIGNGYNFLVISYLDLKILLNTFHDTTLQFHFPFDKDDIAVFKIKLIVEVG